MSNSLERKASVLNGLIIVGSCVLGVFEATRSWGIGIAIFMGAGLIFSGWANFCGWYRILGPRGSSHTNQSPFWIGGRDAHRKGLKGHYDSQISKAVKMASDSDTEDEKTQHLNHAEQLRAVSRLKLEETHHAVY